MKRISINLKIDNVNNRLINVDSEMFILFENSEIILIVVNLEQTKIK